MEKIKAILDVDTGSDDAIAIITATLHPALDLLAITTVAGNKGLAAVTDNTLRVVDLLGSGTPVYAGCDEPMVAELTPDRHAQSRQAPQSKKSADGKVIEYHSETLPLPAPKSKARETSAVCFLIDTLMASDGDIVLIPTGPLTNIAMALRCEPRIKQKIKRLVIMGGGHRKTNRTSAAEFNIWNDPEAAQIVFTSGCDVLLVPLDATHDGSVTADESKIIRAIGTPAAVAVADLLDQRILAYDAFQPQDIPHSTPPHDALAVCAAIDESVLKDVQLRRVDVDFSGGVCDGMTVVDQRVYPDKKPNIRFAFSCHREKFVKMLTETIALSKRG